ncbi:hypothetical protein GCK72_023749 [Caenorhabditis remanei]|uniref:Uncharacterized protein n=1 Tax=Caenorhabditis remanei TaxID=31234 RepID=A0A6A5FXN6_CAERE|nr:hypothetical protein GCK72_023749 [Caenorhabditis remanei]KAF1747287.1 hypothetical protein GCK72_023749 [Caenorhabditis remanei]
MIRKESLEDLAAAVKDYRCLSPLPQLLHLPLYLSSLRYQLVFVASSHRHRNRIGNDVEFACAQTGLNISKSRSDYECIGHSQFFIHSFSSSFLLIMFTEFCTVFATVELLCMMYRQFDHMNNSEVCDEEGIVLHKKYYETERRTSPFWNNL